MPGLAWDEVARRFDGARNWWVHTTGVGGPHAVPLWGVVLDGVLTFYGDPDTVRSRNLARDARLVLTLEDGERPCIVHGSAQVAGRAADDPAMVDAYRRKYRGPHDADYLLDTAYAEGAMAYQVRPAKALAWEVTSLDEWEVRRWRAPRG